SNGPGGGKGGGGVGGGRGVQAGGKPGVVRWEHGGGHGPGRRTRGGGPGHRRLHGHGRLKGAAPPAPGRAAPFVAVLWRQFAGGCSKMDMVPVKISSLMRKTIAVT